VNNTLSAGIFSLGKDHGKVISGDVIVIFDQYGSPLVAVDKIANKLTLICTHEKPEDMRQFLARHNIPTKVPSVTSIRVPNG
jgi:hypothetical protein